MNGELTILRLPENSKEIVRIFFDPSADEGWQKKFEFPELNLFFRRHEDVHFDSIKDLEINFLIPREFYHIAIVANNMNDKVALFANIISFLSVSTFSNENTLQFIVLFLTFQIFNLHSLRISFNSDFSSNFHFDGRCEKFATMSDRFSISLSKTIKKENPEFINFIAEEMAFRLKMIYKDNQELEFFRVIREI